MYHKYKLSHSTITLSAINCYGGQYIIILYYPTQLHIYGGEFCIRFRYAEQMYIVAGIPRQSYPQTNPSYPRATNTLADYRPLTRGSPEWDKYV